MSKDKKGVEKKVTPIKKKEEKKIDAVIDKSKKMIISYPKNFKGTKYFEDGADLTDYSETSIEMLIELGLVKNAE